MTPPTLSAVLITLNEEKNVSECLKALEFCDEIVVVDSGSSDQTVALARSSGARVFSNAFADFASQKNFAIGQARGDWVFLIDADERVLPALRDEIQSVLRQPEGEGYYVIRLNYIFGRLLKYGDCRRDKQLRLVRRPIAFFKGLVHERISLDSKTRCLKNPLVHVSTPRVTDYMRKLNHYTSLEAQVLKDRQAVFSRAQVTARPLARFFYLHAAKLGFLDRIEGFLFNVLSAYYEFVRFAKQWELMDKGKVRS